MEDNMGEIDSTFNVFNYLFNIFSSSPLGVCILIIFALFIFFIAFIHLCPSIKKNYDETSSIIKRIIYKLQNSKKTRRNAIIIGLIIILFLFLILIFFNENKTNNVNESINNSKIETTSTLDTHATPIITSSNTIATTSVTTVSTTEKIKTSDSSDDLNPGPDILYPIDIFVSDVQKVGDWYYFIYNTDLTDKILMPVLYKSQYEDLRVAERVSPRSCDKYYVSNDCVFYTDYTYINNMHGELYVSRPDGKNERLLQDEIFYFELIDDYIYYSFDFDTVGVGIDGHAIHRMNLDGSNKIIVAYETKISKYGICHHGYRVVGEWVYCRERDIENGEWIYSEDKYRIKMGEPATGLEKVEFLVDIDDEWIYYVTNRLIKAKPDGSEIIELDDMCDFDYSIYDIDSEWIYYYKHGEQYKIKKDGTSKTLIE